jgi:hypothetical protein
LTLSRAFSLIRVDAINDLRVILWTSWSINWSTELILWDHFSGIAQDTVSRAVVLWGGEARFPLGSCDEFNIWGSWHDWMAELLGEEWSWEFSPHAAGGWALRLGSEVEALHGASSTNIFARSGWWA